MTAAGRRQLQAETRNWDEGLAPIPQPGDGIGNTAAARRSAVGLLLGVVGSYGSVQVAGTLLFGVTAGDRATVARMAVLLMLVSRAGFAIPVRAATRLDALAAIRHE